MKVFKYYSQEEVQQLKSKFVPAMPDDKVYKFALEVIGLLPKDDSYEDICNRLYITELLEKYFFDRDKRDEVWDVLDSIKQELIKESLVEREAKFTHINSDGQAYMVDVSDKQDTEREARAEAVIQVSSKTLQMIMSGSHHKGDVFATARIAGIQAAKKTWELIPLCHSLSLSKVEVNLVPLLDCNQIRIESLCKLRGKTGVEMEALTAVSVAALTIYDMCKAVQRDIVIKSIRVLEKSGGRSGHFIAE